MITSATLNSSGGIRLWEGLSQIKEWNGNYIDVTTNGTEVFALDKNGTVHEYNSNAIHINSYPQQGKGISISCGGNKSFTVKLEDGRENVYVGGRKVLMRGTAKVEKYYAPSTKQRTEDVEEEQSYQIEPTEQYHSSNKTDTSCCYYGETRRNRYRREEKELAELAERQKEKQREEEQAALEATYPVERQIDLYIERRVQRFKQNWKDILYGLFVIKVEEYEESLGIMVEHTKLRWKNISYIFGIWIVLKLLLGSH